MKYSLQTVRQVWDETTEERIEVGVPRLVIPKQYLASPDLVEIRQYDASNKLRTSITMSREQAELVRDALNAMVG